MFTALLSLFPPNTRQISTVISVPPHLSLFPRVLWGVILKKYGDTLLYSHDAF